MKRYDSAAAQIATATPTGASAEERKFLKEKIDRGRATRKDHKSVFQPTQALDSEIVWSYVIRL